MWTRRKKTSPQLEKNHERDVAGFAFETEADDRENAKKALLAALVLALAVIWAPAPSWSRSYAPPPQPKRVDPTRVIIKPKPHQPQTETRVIQRRNRRTPMPVDQIEAPAPVDLTMTEPDIDVVAVDSEWVFEPVDPRPPAPSILTQNTPGLEPPLVTRRVSPNYPPLAARVGISGYVILEAVMRADGTIDQIKVIRGLARGKFGFEDEAVNALKDWEFIPGQYQGRAVDVRLNVRIDFVMNR